ncbi:phosphate/phosphite/phosphonate ABC transporter substrate-binding protein [Halomonas sp. MCCC 1A17488]|uniref:Phosphate/phosphite/phosphonate ABC transporter substrate-binding protein n=1 Tax=Billgrantia sulfidoxydans TaxID=2733484 RepID=A0ABX7W8W9_9GAMM|nr:MULTISPECIES: phosphate/phosphite/phosphonate ABC transporter substrate-binding protein [Halomonas]MCE8017391.1 phosphate/phosphite/phosphonate ABC transporter substrate-binding protein [Halomonas sp. MCCC 1A17488]MCG3240724.1 phosphate/phosphite/phosphonate ABC transporter substrate-binding protein [Halomonas sp. MCCC 1A17488]QPP49438.1 phosphate/phosphite/phosphonate ABC transporter substrate-binding protein [Halomonas sp. SS10-MC5]QTP56796.1 phosphate/phosphite/phosphonate ABC transporter
MTTSHKLGRSPFAMLVLSSLLPLALLVSAQAQAQSDCQRGALDALYCDEDGDLVADRPADESEWVDPDTLIFAYTPVEDPAIYADIWQPFIDHLQEVTGRDVRFFAVQSNSAQVEAMRSGRLHIAGFSTGPTPFAVNLAGAVPFALMGSDDGQFGYTLQVYTHVDSDIEEMADLKGKRVAHTSPTSNSGNQAPRALFPELGVVPDEDYEVVYSGSHDQSMLGVVARDYDAAPVASEVVERMAARGLYDEDEVRMIFESDRFPTTSYTYAHNLHPDLVDKIEEAFFSFDFAGTALGDEFEGVEKFIPINYQEHWKVIRTIQEANGVRYTREDLEQE